MKKTSERGAGRRVAAAAAVSAAFLVPLAAFGGPALARSGGSASAQGEYGSGSSQYQYRVQICHRTGHSAHTITVAKAAVKAHLRHGDHLGACTAADTGKHKGKAPKKHTPKKHDASAPTTPSTSSGDHGKSGDDHGKGHKGK